MGYSPKTRIIPGWERRAACERYRAMFDGALQREIDHHRHPPPPDYAWRPDWHADHADIAEAEKQRRIEQGIWHPPKVRHITPRPLWHR